MPKVSFIGAGPGDPDLLTVKAARLIGQADLVLYAGSLVQRAVAELAGGGAKIVDSAPMTLEQTHACMVDAIHQGCSVARVHTGDPALYGAVQEQIALLRRDGIDWEIIPGVTSASAAAAAFGASFTLPEQTQTLMLTRLAGRTAVPESERLRDLAAHKTALAVYLSGSNPEGVQSELLAAGYPPETPIAIAHKVSWPGERLCRAPLFDLAKTVRAEGITSQTLFLVLPDPETGTPSRLYAEDFAHACRP
ncbi:precorrin-4 C(11)-methyltransferase [Desulfovibrio inopinatus]|uniref:precorrin-4 C(11)-methyltransferase n=1 Tax=Desulfovibrio inopinatus TaxID=102109 RepID=UPI00040330F4|nr:precorrin-4 C(11)-methyltransferase [Desulfovibrio inopinatus]